MEDELFWVSTNTITLELEGSELSHTPHYGKDPENLGPVPKPDLTFQVYTKTVDDKEYTRKEISRISDTKSKTAVMGPTLLGFLIVFVLWFASISALLFFFFSIPMIPLNTCAFEICWLCQGEKRWDENLKQWVCDNCDPVREWQHEKKKLPFENGGQY